MKIKINSDVYPLEAILNACYVFIDRAYFFLDSGLNKRQIEVFMKSKGKVSKKCLNLLREEFMNELLHSTLRYSLSKNNKKVREYIVGRALYSFLPPLEDLTKKGGKLDYQEDPLGIAQPWKDKSVNKKHDKAKV